MMSITPNATRDDSSEGQTLAGVVFAALSAEHGWIDGGMQRPEDDGTPVSTAIAQRVSKAVELFLQSEPLLPTHVLGDNHDRLEYQLCQCIGLRSEASSDGVLERQLRCEMANLARKYYYTHPMVRERLRKAAETKASRGLDDVQKMLGRAKQTFKLKELQIAEALAGGLSGSLVIRVYYRADEQSTELGVFKGTADKEEFDRELNGHRAACRSWMTDWVEPRLLNATLFDGDTGDNNAQWFVLLTPLAFPPSRSKQVIPSLHDLISKRSETTRCDTAVNVLGAAYAQQFESLRPNGQDFMPVKDIFLKTLQNWPKPYRDNTWNDGAFWKPAGLPLPTTACFQDGERVLWNPLWLISNGNVGGKANVEGRFTEQHGDLNARNVMLPIEAVQVGKKLPILRLIDFEKWTHQSAVLDPCWLALAILKAGAPSRPTCDSWFDLPSRFVSAVLNQGVHREGDSGYFQLGLNLVDRLFSPYYKMAERTGEVMHNSVSNMLSTTLAAAGLAFAYYETRALHTRPDMVSNEDEWQYRRLWALFGFRVAALCLRPLEVQDVRGQPGVNTRDILESVFAK